MTDRELLEYAAKAAGYLNWTPTTFGLLIETGSRRGDAGFYWNPLTDDGDALRLAVKLRIDNYHLDYYVATMHRDHEWSFDIPVKDDREAATRRAIVRAAAEIGKERA